MTTKNNKNNSFVLKAFNKKKNVCPPDSILNTSHVNVHRRLLLKNLPKENKVRDMQRYSKETHRYEFSKWTRKFH